VTAERIFLTGVSGFIGQYAARQMRARGRQIVALTRDRRRLASDLVRQVEVVQADLMDPGLAGQLKGCDAVVHCAKNDNPDPVRRAEADVIGTRQLLDAAVASGVRRFVYLSSIAAYGATPDGIVDETFSRIPAGDLYGRTKLELEEEVLARASTIEVVVLQPGNVYGAGRCWWGQGLIDLMRRGKVILVNDGSGIANMVHVLDVVQVIEKALDMPAVNGESFLITDGQPLPWREYYSALEHIAGCKAIMSMPAGQARILSRELHDRSLSARVPRYLARTFLRRPLVFPLSDDAIETFCRKTVFSIAKARARLGYEPRYDLAAGLKTLAAGDRSCA
jgi:nucleoside-diphosphate-sugar epimerase